MKSRESTASREAMGRQIERFCQLCFLMLFLLCKQGGKQTPPDGWRGGSASERISAFEWEELGFLYFLPA